MTDAKLSAGVRIRPYREADFRSVATCMVHLQDHERRSESDRNPGARMARGYVRWLIRECRTNRGSLLVAEVAGQVAGFVAFWPQRGEEARLVLRRRTGYVSDLVVRPGLRRRGIGRRLLHAAEAGLRRGGARQVVLGVLVGNRIARALYRAAGYEPYTLVLRRRW